MSSTDGQDLKHDGDQRIEYSHDGTTDLRAAEEALGTVIVAEKERDSRSALRPQPSLDPNDPLVSLKANPCDLQVEDGGWRRGPMIVLTRFLNRIGQLGKSIPLLQRYASTPSSPPSMPATSHLGFSFSSKRSTNRPRTLRI